MKKKKIAIFHELIYPYTKGGGEVQRYEIAKHLSRFGYDVSLIGHIMPHTAREEKRDGFTIKRTGLKSFPVRDVDDHLRRIISILHMIWKAMSEKYDTAMTNPFFPLIPVLLMAKLRNKPVIVTWDDVFGYKTFRKHKGPGLGLFGAMLERINLFFTKFADRVLAVSESTKRKLASYGVETDKITIIYSGINPDSYKTMPMQTKNHITFVGRHVFYKNVEDLLKAFIIVHKKHPHTHLKILGYGSLTKQYKKKTKELGLSNIVDFEGFVPHREKIKTLTQSICAVLPSSFEGFGLTNIEANICGRPYVTYDIPATREITNITKGGILVEHKNIKQLANAINDLIEHPQKANKIGKQGQKNVKKHFTWKKTAKNVEKVIKSEQ